MDDLRYTMLFERSSLSIMEEDFGGLQQEIDSLTARLVEEHGNKGTPLALLEEYLDAHPGVVFELISKVKILNVNRAALNLYHFASKEEMEGSLEKIMDQGAWSFLKGEILAQAAGEIYFEGETVNTTKEGQKLDLLISIAFPEKSGPGGVGVVTILDISARKQQEREQEAKRYLSETLREITVEMTGEIHRDTLLDKILQQLKRMINFTSGNIKMFDRQGKLKLVRSIGYEAWGALDFVKNHVIEPEQYPVIQKIMESGEALIIDDAHNYSGWTLFPETSYIRSVIFLPLVEGPQMIGEISLESDQLAAFSREDTEKLHPFAAAVSVALKNSALYEKVAEASRRQELLLRELHHRVKNNLALINSLMHLQFDHYEDPQIKILLEQAQSKIFSILLVHQKLHDGESLEHIPLREYLQDLLEELAKSNAREIDLTIQLDLEQEIFCEPDTLIPLGLITTEIFTNSMKHAKLKEDERLLFGVESHSDETIVHLRFFDNGQDFTLPEKGNSGLGLNLINSLSEQIDGEYLLQKTEAGGCCSVISFPAHIC